MKHVRTHAPLLTYGIWNVLSTLAGSNTVPKNGKCNVVKCNNHALRTCVVDAIVTPRPPRGLGLLALTAL
jgi:hypothetical protein